MVSSDHLEPGESGAIKATVSTRGKKGRLVKTVQVKTNDPAHPLTILKLRAKVVDPYHTGITSPSAIFSDPCRSCHVERGIGKMGAVLYRADCLICHRRGRRAGSISDMRKLSRDNLGKIITYGIKDTMMPGFGSIAGGPLTEQQINSLIRYIKKGR